MKKTFFFVNKQNDPLNLSKCTINLGRCGEVTFMGGIKLIVVCTCNIPAIIILVLHVFKSNLRSMQIFINHSNKCYNYLSTFFGETNSLSLAAETERVNLTAP